MVGTFTASGSVLSGSAAYDPLGNVLGVSSRTGNLGYQSEYTDPSTAQVDMAARWYNPATGQFTGKDTATVDPAGNSAAANPFAYTGDDPLLATDPSGHCPTDICGGGYIKPGGGSYVAYDPSSARNEAAHYSRTEAADNARAWALGVQREKAQKAAAARAAAARHHSFWGSVWHQVSSAAKVVARVAVKAAKVAYVFSGAADVVGCVTHPTLMGCIQGALAIASVIPVIGEAGMIFRAAKIIRTAAEYGNRLLPYLQAADDAAHGDWRGALESATIGAVASRLHLGTHGDEALGAVEGGAAKHAAEAEQSFSKDVRLAASSSADAEKPEMIRMRHYTSVSGRKGIVESGVIRAADQNKVFLLLARGKALSPRDAESQLGIGRGRGNSVIEFDVPKDRVTKRYNATMNIDEWVADGDLIITKVKVVR